MHLKSILAVLFFFVLGAQAALPPPITRNFFSTNSPTVIPFADPGVNALGGWDDTTGTFRPIFIGANLTYTPGTFTLSSSAGGGSQTPWTSDIDGDGFSLTNVFTILTSNLQAGVKIVGGTNITTGIGSSVIGTANGGTNQASGLGSVVVGLAGATGWNHASGSGSHVIGSIGTSGGRQSVFADLSGIHGFANGGTNEILSFGTSHIFIGGATSGGQNRIAHTVASLGTLQMAFATGAASTNEVSSAVTATEHGHKQIAYAGAGGRNTINTFAAGGGTLQIVTANGGTNQNIAAKSIQMGIADPLAQNLVSGLGAIQLATSFTGGSNNLSVQGILAGVSAVGGYNLVSGARSIAIANNTSGTNTITATDSLLLGGAISGSRNTVSSVGGRVFATASAGGLNNVTGDGSYVSGRAVTATNQVSGIGSQLFGYADSDVGSLVATGDRSVTFGSGGTNVASDSFVFYSRGAPLIFAKTNLVGINTDAPTSVLDVNGATTHRGSVTNLDLLAAQYMATDSGKKEVSTLDGGAWTNLNGTNVVGTLTNNTLGNASTATTATTATSATNIYLNVYTNAFTGPTNSLPIGSDSTYTTLGDVAITNLIGGVNATTSFASLGVFNSSGSNTIIFLTLDCTTPDGARSYTLTNNLLTLVSVRRSVGHTNITVVPFF